mmetsp:Transcript_60905/g.83636  ORF Transcript_60905/g.83636 Transcript_60905/m.83636 type:complete len:211 (-) Transcript_60905:522-1154(-)
MSRVQDLGLDIRLHRIPFFLEPGYLNHNDSFREPHLARMTRKFGSVERFEMFKMHHGLVPRGAQVGIEGWTEEALSRRVQSATLRSHRLVQWVSQHYGGSTAEKLFSGLGRRHFIEGGALNDVNVMLAAAAEAEVDVTTARTFLESNLGEDEVLTTVERVHRLGIDSIPTLVVDGGAVILSGANSADEIETALRSITRNRQPSGGRLFRT